MDSAQVPVSFKEVFYTHYLSVVRKMQGLLRDRQAAEDVAQETFLRLYRHPPDDMTRVGAWLHKTATRLAYNHLSQQSRHQQTLTAPQTRATEEWHPASEDEVMSKLERHSVGRALGRLSDRDRQVLLLKHSGYSYREIAEILDVNPETVGTLIARATDRFKREYQTEEGLGDGSQGRQRDVARHSG